MNEDTLTFEEFHWGAERYLRHCVQELLENGGFPVKWQPDHIGYTCGSREEFSRIWHWLRDLGLPVIDRKVDDRTVLCVGLEYPCVLKERGYAVYVLEVADQTPEGLQRSEFHHLGIVPDREMLGTEQFVGGISKRSKKNRYGFKVKRFKDSNEKGYDVHLEDGFRVRISDRSLYQLLEESARVPQAQTA